MADATATVHVTVVTPTHNRRESLWRTLQALTKQDFPAAHFEVVVVADGCTDGTLAMLEQVADSLPFTLRWIVQEQAGPASARNAAIAAARGEIIAFLDDDVEPLPAWLMTHVAHHERAERVVVIGPLSPGRPQRSVWVRWEDDRLQRQYRAMLAGDYAPTPRQFYTGNSSVRRRWIIAAGGFDGRLRRAEDVELAFRLHDLGLHFTFDPAADGLHHANRTYPSWRAIPAQYGRNDVLMARELDRDHLLRSLCREFHRRRRGTQWLVRFCVGHRVRLRVVLAALTALVHVADRPRLDRWGQAACSGVWNLAYWNGLAEALGGPRAFWRMIDAEERARRDDGATTASS